MQIFRKNRRLKLLFLALYVFTCSVEAQNSRELIRNHITKWGECKNVAITKSNGDLALYGENGWVGTGLPSLLSERLSDLNDEGRLIDDVQLTEEGRWIILFGDNEFYWYDIPYSLERRLKTMHEENEIVLSVTFNDDNDWIVISKDHYAASSEEIQNWLKEGAKEFGMLWAACLSDDALVACYEKGYKFLGNVPDNLVKALQSSRLNVFRIKIAGASWFFADIEGECNYEM